MKRLQFERQYLVLKKAFEDLKKDHELCESLITDLKKDKDTLSKKNKVLEDKIKELEDSANAKKTSSSSKNKSNVKKED